MNLTHCFTNSFNYLVNVAQAQPNDRVFYVDVCYDCNRDGDWDDSMACPDGTPVPEWAVQNQAIGPFPVVGQYGYATPLFLAWHRNGLADGSALWMRITLSEQKAQPAAGVVGGGGSGPAAGYELGETEDYYVEDWVQDAVDFGDAPDRTYPT